METKQVQAIRLAVGALVEATEQLAEYRALNDDMRTLQAYELEDACIKAERMFEAALTTKD